MFTIEQIRTAHANVKSGADFPAYVQEIIKLGVTGYECFVTDGHTLFFGNGGYHVQSGARYDALTIADKGDNISFRSDLKEHQQGKTSFPEFCGLCARAGVEKWIVDMGKMTCAYYDRAGNEMLVELIPLP